MAKEEVDRILMPPPRNISPMPVSAGHVCEAQRPAGLVQLSLPEYQNRQGDDNNKRPREEVDALENNHENDLSTAYSWETKRGRILEPHSGDQWHESSQPHGTSIQPDSIHSFEQQVQALPTNDDAAAAHFDVLFYSGTMVGSNSDQEEQHEEGKRLDDSTCTTLTASSQQDISQAPARYDRPDPDLPRFSEIIGHGAAKLRMEEILLPVALPASIAKSVLTGVRSMPASIFLHGPPGCGKTQLARALAGEAQAAFISVGPSDVLSKFVGESEAAIRRLFSKAFEKAARMETRCAVLFLDEIDALGFSRSGGCDQGGVGESSSRRVLATLLIEMNKLLSPHRPQLDSWSESESDSHDADDVTSQDNERHYSYSEEENGTYHGSAELDQADSSPVRVIVVAATNRFDDCDPALIRRFGVRVFVGLPNAKNRKRILRRLLKGIVHNISKDELAAIADELEGWSGSELESLTREAAMAPVRELIRKAAREKRERKRALDRQQAVVDLSSPSVGGNMEQADPNQEAKACMLKGLQGLRAVTVQDFNRSCVFFDSGGAVSNLEDDEVPANNGLNYDSSSSSDDAD